MLPWSPLLGFPFLKLHSLTYSLSLHHIPLTRLLLILQYCFYCFPGSSDSKESVCSARDPGSISESGRSPGEGNGNPLQYPCLENFMDRGAWWVTVLGVAELDMVNFHFSFSTSVNFGGCDTSLQPQRTHSSCSIVQLNLNNVLLR